MNQINSLLSAWKRAYSQQGQATRVLIPALFLLVICCLCSITLSLFRSRGPANAVPSPNASNDVPTAGGQATPTPLFDFDFPTFTPFPTSTFFLPTAFPTLTPPPTGTQAPTTIAPTSTAPTITATPIPTDTATQVPPTATTIPGPVVILAVHKAAENVDLQNIGGATVDLRGWRLVSEAGDQSCELSGMLKPGEVIRVWASRGPGFDCRLPGEIWMDNALDPAVLYNPQGQEVSRVP